MLTKHPYPAAFTICVCFLAACSTGHGASAVSEPSAGSSQGGDPGRAEAGAAGLAETTGTEGGAAGSSDADICSAATDCDDGLSCDGLEACVAGKCQAGTPTQCDVGMECSEGQSGECIFTDQSPWIVYEADDDTPGVPEVYAVKRGLLGKVQPIKLNAPLEEGWAVRSPGVWSPDHQLYAFTVTRLDPYEEAVQVVHFGNGLPEPAIQLSGEQVQWSPSGKLLAIGTPLDVSIYTYTDAGKLELLYRDRDDDREQLYGYWGEDDAFVFAAQRSADKRWDISRAYFDGAAWRTASVVPDLDLLGFEVTPSLKEVVYATHGKTASEQYLFAQSLKQIDSPTTIASPGWATLGWSQDAKSYLLSVEVPANSAAPREMQVFLGTGDAADLNRRELAQLHSVGAAGFTPDGNGVVVRRADPDWGEAIIVHDLTTGTSTRLGYLVDHTDESRWSPDGGWVAVPNHTSETSDVELTLFGVAPAHDTLRLDSISANLRYYNLQFSKGSRFFAYYKGDGPNRDYDAAYVDLRYHTVVDPKPVRLPGEGKMWTMNFDPDGSGLYYIRERSNGARDCFFLDLSQQVAKDAVQINRAGRVDHCYAQALSE